MPAGTFLPPGLTTSDVKITSGGTDNYVMTAVDGETIQGEANLTFDGSDLTLADDVGIIFGDAGEKIEGDGTNLVVESSGALDMNSGGVLTLDSGAAINLEPASGSAILLDGTISVDAGVVTGVTALTSGTINAFTLGGDITGGSNNIDGMNRMASTYFLTGNGTTSVSGYGFTTDPDTGLNLASAGILNVMVGGVVEASFSSTGLTLGGGVSADTAFIFDNAGTDYHIGIEQAEDNLVIGTGTTLGTDTILNVDGGKSSVGINFVPVAYAGSLIISSIDTDADGGTGALNITNESYSVGGTSRSEHQLIRFQDATVTGTSALTLTTAATVRIDGGPIAGSNVTITNDYALWVETDYSRFDAGIIIGAATSTNNLIDDSTTGSGTTTLYVGNASITVSSDERLKTDIRPTAINALSLVDKFKVMDFGWDDPTDTVEYGKNYRGRYTGMIAQDTVKIAPWIINDQGGGRDCNQCMSGDECDNHGMWQVEYQHLVPTLVKAIQELSEKIQELEHGNR